MSGARAIVYKYGYPAGAGVPDISPFVVKLETWLRMSAIPYEAQTGVHAGMPRGKLPVALIEKNFEAYHRPLLIDYAVRGAPRALRSLVPIFAPLVLPFSRRTLARQAWAQGMGRRSYDEVVAKGVEAWTAITTLLGDQPFLFGDRPSVIDASAFAWVHCTLKHPFESPVLDHIRSTPTLVAYHDRIWGRYWRDLNLVQACQTP